MSGWASPWKRRLFSAGIVAVVALSVVVVAIVAQTEEPPRTQGPGVEPLSVRWQQPQPSPGYTKTRTFVGRVEARQESALGFEIAGKVNRVSVSEGERVAAGQLLAELDTQLLDTRREELRASRDEAKAQLELAEIRLQRVTRARKQQAATADELDEATQTRSAATAALARSEAAIASLEAELEKSELRAPYAAIVAARHVDAGRVVTAGAAVVDLLEYERPEVRVGLGGAMSDRLDAGQTHTLNINGQPYAATVARILPVRSQTGRDVEVIFALDTPLGEVRRGDLARLALSTEIAEPGYWLPLQALTEGVRGLWSVYTVEDAGVAGDTGPLRRVDVEVLHTLADRVYVRAALEPGAVVALGGLQRVAPGMLVRLDKQGPAMSDVSDAALNLGEQVEP